MTCRPSQKLGKSQCQRLGFAFFSDFTPSQQSWVRRRIADPHPPGANAAQRRVRALSDPERSARRVLHGPAGEQSPQRPERTRCDAIWRAGGAIQGHFVRYCSDGLCELGAKCDLYRGGAWKDDSGTDEAKFLPVEEGIWMFVWPYFAFLGVFVG